MLFTRAEYQLMLLAIFLAGIWIRLFTMIKSYSLLQLKKNTFKKINDVA